MVRLNVCLQMTQVKAQLHLEGKERPGCSLIGGDLPGHCALIGSSQQELNEGPGGVRLGPVLAVDLQVVLQVSQSPASQVRG